MGRILLVKKKGSVGRGRLACLGVFLAITIHFIVHYEGNYGIDVANREWGSVLVLSAVEAVSPDELTGLSRRRWQRSRDGEEENYERKIVDTWTFNSKRRLSIRMIQSARKSFGNKVIERNAPFSKILNTSPRNWFRKEKKQATLLETTRLVGGANENIERKEDPQESKSSSNQTGSPSITSSNTRRWKTFVISDILPKTQQLLFPKESEIAMRRKFQQTLMLLHKAISQAGPCVLAAISLVGSRGNQNGISLPTLYILALLGASCGFHLFLHFITLGYALGVTLPLTVALFFYKVRLLYE